MKREWIRSCIYLSLQQADFFSGARKILRNRSLTFKEIKDDLTIEDSGFTKSKMSMLKRLYLHQESIDAAVLLWEKRKGQRKYGSVGFSCYNHLMKNDMEKKSKRASVMGPCLQSVILTYMNDHSTEVDVFYRTTELYKKFPADLVFIRDVLLPHFDFTDNPIRCIRFHFANVTIHPMYFVTIVPHLPNPVDLLQEIKKSDDKFHEWIVKWTSRYLIKEFHRGIEKFAQAMRVHMDVQKRFSKKHKKSLRKYLKKHHPGFNKEYKKP